MTKNITALLLFFLGFVSSGFAQTNTLKLTLQTAESLFLSNNRDLLAANYQIEEAKAAIITAKLFDNPELQYENLFYNHETKKFLQTSYQYGQYSGSISQLIKLAGKRNKNIKLAETGGVLAENAYFDLLRTLRFELRSTFYETYFLSRSVATYEQQILATQQLLNVYEEQLKMGNVALKEVIRVRSLVFALKAELAELLNELEDHYKTLRLFCGIDALKPISLVADVIPQETIAKTPYSVLLDSAKLNRADLKLANTGLRLQQQNLKLQKATAIPDVEISLTYDLKGNYPEKYTGLGISIPIPLFNRNQGEIKKANIGIQAAQNRLAQQEDILQNEVSTSLNTAIRIEKLYQELDPASDKDFNKMMVDLTQHLKQKDISLLEFLDLYDAYKEHTLKLNKLRFQNIKAKEEINYVTGSKIFK
ncbi:TolC family protein [Pedobacter arcticus]|uniref:TolC family protein n=1 Tax=Pedobacter arcticus TaxID=752140 RepID=UPI0002E70A93|nr:TolC family protein [Pedobacter arcticus]